MSETLWQKIIAQLQSDTTIDDTDIMPAPVNNPDFENSKLPKLREYEEAPA